MENDRSLVRTSNRPDGHNKSVTLISGFWIQPSKFHRPLIQRLQYVGGVVTVVTILHGQIWNKVLFRYRYLKVKLKLITPYQYTVRTRGFQPLIGIMSDDWGVIKMKNYVKLYNLYVSIHKLNSSIKNRSIISNISIIIFELVVLLKKKKKYIILWFVKGRKRCGMHRSVILDLTRLALIITKSFAIQNIIFSAHHAHSKRAN